MFKQYVRNGGACLLLWWLVVYVQSIRNIGLVSTILFFFSVVVIALRYHQLRVPLLCGAFFLPLAALDIPSPFVVTTALVGLSVLVQKTERKTIIHPLVVFYGLFLALALFSIAYTPHPDPWHKMVDYAQAGVFLALLALLVSSEAEVVCIMSWLALFAALSLVVSYTHYHLGSENTYLGQKVYGALGEEAMVGKATLSNLDSTRRFIWAGMDPNFYGMALLAGFMAALTMWESGVFKTPYLHAVFLAMIATGILATYSRSTLIVAGVGSVFYYLSLGKFPVKVAVIGAGLLGVLLSYNPQIADRIGTIQDNLVEEGGTGRLDAIKNGLVFWAEAPLGHGIGSVEIGMEPPDQNGNVGTSHSTYVDILAECGFEGLGLFCSMIFCAYRRGRENLQFLYGPRAVFVRGLRATMVAMALFIATIPVCNLAIFFVILFLTSQKFELVAPISSESET